MRKILFLLLSILAIFLFTSASRSALAANPIVQTGTIVGSIFDIGIPIGGYGCSFKNDGKTPSIPCANSGVCVFSTTHYDSGSSSYIGGYCQQGQGNCLYCGGVGYELLQQGKGVGQCHNLSTDQYSTPQSQTCTTGQACSPAYGCGGAPTQQTQPVSLCNGGTSCPTALGDLPTDLPNLLTKIFSVVLAIAGIAALSLIIASGYRLMVSQGNPEQVKGAREQLTAAIIGLLFIIFSIIILQVIGANILKIPGFN